MPRLRRLSCSSCQLLRINGVVTHETGCPDAWRHYKIKCRGCEREFKPKTRWQQFHSERCYRAFYF